MPRALLLKKRKFNKEEDEEAKHCSQPNQDCVKIKSLEPKRKKTADNSVKRSSPSKKIREEFLKEGKLGKHKQTKKKTLVKRINVTLINEDDIDSEDDENNYHGQQHFVKLMKKDGQTRKIWECGICHKEFLHQYTLMRHVPIHTDVRNFKCDVCDKAFRQASTLCRHKAIHSDERPFMCSVCGKAFNRSSTLIAHRKTHSELKRHTCHVCGKGFHQKGNLKNHIYTHTGERPYKCDKCGRGFNQTSNLMCHKAHAHVEKPKHICQSCGKEFPRRFSLRIHEEYKHGIKYDITGEPRIDADKFRELFQSRTIRRGKSTNCVASKTVILPNGDKTIEFTSPVSSPCVGCDRQNTTESITQDKLLSINKPVESAPNIPFFSQNTGLLIEAITTPAMITAQQNNQTPFALFRPGKGLPVLVKILCTVDGKQVLIPATADDLKPDPANKPEGVLQVKVPIVAVVIQRDTGNGKMIIEVEPVDDNVKSEDVIKEELKHSEQLSEMQLTCTENAETMAVVSDELLNSSSEIIIQSLREEETDLNVLTKENVNENLRELHELNS